ncbi:MAG TPA: hypothetical protein VMI94_03300 [Bryobacteraceae bacterium]|nr:hypothetical protein [Bryobacteraceae bacterium]
MNLCRLLTLSAVLALCASAQQKGVEPDWDIHPVLKDIAAHAQHLVPVLDQVDVDTMRKNGAPDTYLAQVNESKVQAKALATEASALANSPDKVSADLFTFFRMQALEKTLLSVEEGIRKYWNPAVADLLGSEMAQNTASRDRFQRFILDLAAEKEQECTVMDHEAQRCRGMLAKQPPKTEKR